MHGRQHRYASRSRSSGWRAARSWWRPRSSPVTGALPVVLAAPKPREQRQPKRQGDQEQQGDRIHLDLFVAAATIESASLASFSKLPDIARPPYAMASVGVPSVGGANHTPRQNGKARSRSIISRRLFFFGIPVS
jgi:hypothetical protein